MREVHLKLNPCKCYFGAQNITFLGHVVNIEGFYLNPKKITIVENFPIPRTITNVTASLGLISTTSFFLDLQKLQNLYLV
jgi:hypothetical protein